jgi:hypothetical protein
MLGQADRSDSQVVEVTSKLMILDARFAAPKFGMRVHIQGVNQALRARVRVQARPTAIA